MRLVALLRGINVGGRNKVPMADLRALAADLGLESIETYIASGNLVCTSARAAAEVEADLEQALAGHFGFEVPVVVRTASQWQVLAASSAFPDAESERPNLLCLGLAKRPAVAGANAVLGDYVRGEERVSVFGEGLWIDYASGVARSKLTPKILDKAFGSPVTCRNWRTVQKLADMLGVSA